MSGFINRFLNIRGVIKNVYMQINELDEFIFRRSVSLGKRAGETSSNWCYRSRATSTYTWDYERGDYIEEVASIAHMKDKIESLLSHLKDIYICLLDTTHCQIPYFIGDDLEKTYESDKALLDVLKPVFFSGTGLDKAMTPDHGLKNIVDDIIKIILLGDDGTDSPYLFYIKGEKQIRLVLQANKFPKSSHEEVDIIKSIQLC
jgi:hypothetical protein